MEVAVPVVRVEFLAGRSQEQKAEIAKVFTRELSRIGKCSEQDVHVIFNEIEGKSWAVGGVFSDHSD